MLLLHDSNYDSKLTEKWISSIRAMLNRNEVDLEGKVFWIGEIAIAYIDKAMRMKINT